ncbi:MAG: prepilin-type N-terminal cleavage/methylation domain-containing protein [Chitinivibrionales bacterium]|nr:prepilin-type N-terminal cleavage/methylation domain-containing protein [Chitinivibrionales bacterium]
MKNNRGLTIVEVLVAVLVLGAATMGAMAMLRTGDRIKVRQEKLSTAALLAQNDAERIKNLAVNSIVVSDTEYEQTINGLTYSIVRSVVEPESLTENSSGKTSEAQISITPSGSEDTLARFRLIQGYFY